MAQPKERCSDETSTDDLRDFLDNVQVGSQTGGVRIKDLSKIVERPRIRELIKRHLESNQDNNNSSP